MPTDLAAVRERIIARPLSLEGVGHLVWGGDDTNSLMFGTCKCDWCHSDTLAMEVGGRAASWGIRRRVTGTSEQQGVWALNGILAAYEDRNHRDTRPELRSLITQQYERNR